jgi:hypothetical protein
MLLFRLLASRGSSGDTEFGEFGEPNPDFGFPISGDTRSQRGTRLRPDGSGLRRGRPGTRNAEPPFRPKA